MKRTKKTARFPIKRRGYDIDAVENYIASEIGRAEGAQLSARERISALEAEREELKKQLGELKGKEEQIKAAFLSATQNADRLTADVRARYSLELNRLKLFRAKWTGAYEQLKERYHFDKDALNMESVAVSVELDLKKMLAQDFSLNNGGGEDEMEMYFKSEVARLTAQQAEEQKRAKNDAEQERDSSALDELKGKIREAEAKADGSAAFSLDEALHPTESLAEICRALGLKAL